MSWVGRSTSLACRQAQVQLNILVLGVGFQPVGPAAKGETSALCAELLVSKPCRACVGVVKLGEDHVKGRLAYSIGQARVGDLTLRSRGDEKAVLNTLELVDEITVVGEDIILVGDCVNGSL
jgi:hypothetical protein